MKINLPRFSDKKGFTLIELLIVIAIIAILSAVGFVTYGSIQKNARDARRRSEVDSIAKALEIRFQTTTGGTCPPSGTSSNGGYYCPLDNSWFDNNVVPTDPTPATTPYCIWFNSSAAITTTPSPWSNGSCPAITGSTATPAAPAVPAVNTASFWKVCAVMEKDNTVFCINSKQ